MDNFEFLEIIAFKNLNNENFGFNNFKAFDFFIIVYVVTVVPNFPPSPPSTQPVTHFHS